MRFNVRSSTSTPLDTGTCFPFEQTALATAIAVICGSATPLALAQDNAADSQSQAPGIIEEVIVTAQKRAASIQDVPLAIQAFTEDRIEELGIHRFEDFALLSPSINIASWIPGTTSMVMRGVSDGGGGGDTAATATLYVDEQPLTFRGQVPDIHHYDIERIEILNGPQGTHYGASATSGAVRIITNKPDPDAFSAGFDLTGGTITDGDSVQTLEGFVNVPLAEGRSALRLVGWYDASLGFVDNLPASRTYVNGVTIDNAGYVQDDYNEEKVGGFRAALRTLHGDRWVSTVSALHQESDIKGSWDYEPDLGGDREVTRFLPEQSDLSYSQLALTLEGDVGIGDLVYAGAYYQRESDTVSDYSSYVAYVPWAGWTQQFACDDYYWYGNTDCNDPSMYFDLVWNVDRWSHEVRLTSPGDGPLNWIVGAFYEETESHQVAFWGMPGIQHGGAPSAYYLGANGGSPLPEEWYFADAIYNWDQLAGFGEIEYQFADRWTATFGARAFRSGYDKAPSPDFNIFYDPKAGGTSVDASSSDVIFKANLTWDVSDNALVYFNFAQGFRPGGANTTAEDDNIPDTYGPDVLDSYEVGWKSTLADGRVTFNGAVYLMQWKDFQTNIYDPDVGVVNFIANVGDAETNGLEFDLQAFLTDNFAIQVGATWNDGELTEPFQASESAFAEKGQRLPLVSKLKTFLNARYEWQQGPTTRGYAQATYAHTGDSWNQLVSAGYVEFAPQLQAGYETVDVRVGWDFRDGRMGLELFGTNLSDEQAQIFINTAQADQRITTIRPRTFGVRLSTRFN